MAMNKKRLGYLYCILAGACDGSTGIMLLLAPLWTLELMQIGALPTEPIYMRFIGVFVMSVGCSYLLPFLMNRAHLDVRLRHMLGFTAFIRVCVASFVLVSVVTHALVSGWLAVLFTDVTFAVTQLWMLKTKLFDSDS